MSSSKTGKGDILKLVEFKKKKEQQEKERETNSKEVIAHRHVLDVQISGVDAQIFGLSVSVESLSFFVMEEGTNQEKVKWQEFEKSFRKTLEKFNEFSESME